MSSKKKAKVRKLVGGGVGERLDAAERMAQMLLGLRQGGEGHGLGGIGRRQLAALRDLRIRWRGRPTPRRRRCLILLPRRFHRPDWTIVV
jgi:hypothetical protein